MAKPTKPQDVSNYKHDDAKRTMIPTAEQQGFVQEDEAKPIKLRYPRNPDLDPQMVWRGHGFLRRAHVRFGHDFEQRRTGTVQIDAGQSMEIFMQRLAGVLFQMRARDADDLFLSIDLDLERALLHHRQLVLRNLVAFG